ncbi:4-hydroxy-2-oxoheptanedioate aldolase [Frateuria aurantia]|uniref:2,4-dihydroxyhept-2-ene-1,7-dioic acid aldolase n=1 Tax=Frateuria aurantia (strain ATCC 33424 / DSM 6220 / KCTC 2777 / LMG 1558 / NBRC 3245 / NCIMB 13370) TaxID=767434 RepID=H8KYQ7_FRAAD|nr:4-hydroxy-2-oxoheptanedioate aldolase [Frateuria aurantia]AFC86128.1 2,4-dihydroxyhept-2-ene-1,7-dioic acid aldolase [Frateuria aurantia DSM 6220]
MKLPVNRFKQRLQQQIPQIGLWLGLADAYPAELLASAGFDWLLIDAEHAPNDLRSVLSQLQAIAPYPSQPVVRPVQGDTALIKQYLDIGAQTLLLPMVESAEQAAGLVAATRYPPAGIRGVGSALARASRWNGIDGYLQHAARQICVLVQVESDRGLKALAEIAAVPGVDGVFFGPADLSASLGHLGQADAPEVQQALAEGIATVRGLGKAAGILSTDPVQAENWLRMGALFVAVGVDTRLLLGAARQLAVRFHH